MIDTIIIRICLSDHSINIEEYRNRLRQIISLGKHGINAKTGNYFILGKHYNLIISLDGDYLSITGSLCKYYLNNNLLFLSKADIKEAIKKLSRELGVNVAKGKLTRIDVGENFEMTYDVKNYIDVLLTLPKAKSRDIRDTKYFDRSRQTLIFYDKMKELNKNSPEVYHFNKSKKNVLRYEIRLVRKLPTLFNVPTVKVVMLYSTSFLKKLAQQWLDNYFLILKQHVEHELNATDPNQLKRFYMYKGIVAMKAENQPDVLKVIDKIRKNHKWNGTTTSRTKLYFNDLLSDRFIVKQSEYAIELDVAIINSNIRKLYT